MPFDQFDYLFNETTPFFLCRMCKNSLKESRRGGLKMKESPTKKQTANQTGGKYKKRETEEQKQKKGGSTKETEKKKKKTKPTKGLPKPRLLFHSQRTDWEGRSNLGMRQHWIIHALPNSFCEFGSNQMILSITNKENKENKKKSQQHYQNRG